ncbi:MAG: hypothetical protein ACI9BW_002699 [Gammaproteobacteria bacterium]|jgi:hypothetical protein
MDLMESAHATDILSAPDIERILTKPLDSRWTSAEVKFVLSHNTRKWVRRYKFLAEKSIYCER